MCKKFFEITRNDTTDEFYIQTCGCAIEIHRSCDSRTLHFLFPDRDMEIHVRTNEFTRRNFT